MTEAERIAELWRDNPMKAWLIADINGGGVWGKDAENVADVLLNRGWKHD